MIFPGFQDTHNHSQDSGHGYGLNANLEAARTVAELQKALKDFAARHKGAWVNGVGLYTGIFTDNNLTRQVLDETVPNRGAPGRWFCRLTNVTGGGCRPTGLSTTAITADRGTFGAAVPEL